MAGAVGFVEKLQKKLGDDFEVWPEAGLTIVKYGRAYLIGQTPEEGVEVREWFEKEAKALNTRMKYMDQQKRLAHFILLDTAAIRMQR